MPVRRVVPWHDAGIDEELVAVRGEHREGHPEGAGAVLGGVLVAGTDQVDHWDPPIRRQAEEPRFGLVGFTDGDPHPVAALNETQRVVQVFDRAFLDVPGPHQG